MLWVLDVQQLIRGGVDTEPRMLSEAFGEASVNTPLVTLNTVTLLPALHWFRSPHYWVDTKIDKIPDLQQFIISANHFLNNHQIRDGAISLKIPPQSFDTIITHKRPDTTYLRWVRFRTTRLFNKNWIVRWLAATRQGEEEKFIDNIALTWMA
jgi:hypothetical protein